MVRAISVLLAVLVLLGVGWYLGRRSTPALRAAAIEVETPKQLPVQDLDVQAKGFEERTQALEEQVKSTQDQVKSAEERARSAEERVAVAEAKSLLWQARSEMLVAAMEVGKRNFIRAREWATSARDHMTHAAATQGLGFDFGPVRNMLDTTINELEVQDAEAVNMLMRAATELRRLLEQAGQA